MYWVMRKRRNATHLNSSFKRLDTFIFKKTATTYIYTLSLHDALPIFRPTIGDTAPTRARSWSRLAPASAAAGSPKSSSSRSEEHTSELQSRRDLVCRLLLEKKKPQ